MWPGCLLSLRVLDVLGRHDHLADALRTDDVYLDDTSSENLHHSSNQPLHTKICTQWRSAHVLVHLERGRYTELAHFQKGRRVDDVAGKVEDSPTACFM